MMILQGVASVRVGKETPIILSLAKYRGHLTMYPNGEEEAEE